MPGVSGVLVRVQPEPGPRAVGRLVTLVMAAVISANAIADVLAAALDPGSVPAPASADAAGP